MHLFMDKSWMQLFGVFIEYLIGLEAFLDFTFANSSSCQEIVCLVKKYKNVY